MYGITPLTYMTAGTHERLPGCTMYPVIGSVIFCLLTFLQQVASFSPKTNRYKKTDKISFQMASVGSCRHVHLQFNLTCWSRLNHGHHDDGDQRTLQQDSTVNHFQKRMRVNVLILNGMKRT